jgi:hypothetical protein
MCSQQADTPAAIQQNRMWRPPQADEGGWLGFGLGKISCFAFQGRRLSRHGSLRQLQTHTEMEYRMGNITPCRGSGFVVPRRGVPSPPETSMGGLIKLKIGPRGRWMQRKRTKEGSEWEKGMHRPRWVDGGWIATPFSCVFA